MVSSWITPRARKGDPSRIASRGLHATEPIAAGEIVAVKGSRRTINGRDWQRTELQDRYRGYFSWYLGRKIDGRLELHGG